MSNLSSTALPLEAASCCASKSKAAETPRVKDERSFVEQYRPVLIIAAAALAGGLALGAGTGTGTAFSPSRAMEGFMGLFLFPLALLKLFDIRGFAGAFTRYDIVAKVFPAYGYIYPVLELALAIGFIAGLWIHTLYALTIVIMGVGGIGIVRTLAKGEKVQCACVGAKLNVPLGSVSLAETLGMAVMSAWMLAVV